MMHHGNMMVFICRRKLANLPRDVFLYAKDIAADVEDKVAQGILNALDKLKKTSVERRLASMPLINQGSSDALAQVWFGWVKQAD